MMAGRITCDTAYRLKQKEISRAMRAISMWE